jgi:glycosyltransferase involved in cell wall biosynthesis
VWKGKSISVILPTYNEKDSIRQCINDFEATGVVDEIIVVNNNAISGTSEEVKATTAREIFETRQGYGSAIRRGFQEAHGDYMVVCEPDGTFVAQDIFKLIAYGQDYEVVFGSRTIRAFIWSGANMGFFLRWGNYLVAKLLEFLFNTNHLSDVGCTLRLISRRALERMLPAFRVYDNYFGPEMMLLSARLDLDFIQIAVNYKERVGKSSVTGSLLKAFLVGIQMILLILNHRMEGSLRDRFLPVKNIGDLMMTPYYYLFHVCLLALAGFFLIKPIGEYLSGDASLFVALVQEILGYGDMPQIDLHSGLSIWHPLLYVGLLVTVGKIFGPHLICFRFLGVAFLLLDLYLIKKLCFCMVSNQRQGRFLTLFSCALFLMMPFTLKGGVHIDIDNSVLPPLLLFFAYTFVQYEQTAGKKKIKFALIACLVMIAALWAKLTTPLLIPIAMSMYYFARRDRLKAFLNPLLLTFIAISFFLVTWYVFCIWAKFPAFSVFTRIVGVFGTKIGASLNILERMRYAEITMFVMNPLAITAWLFFFALNIKDLWKSKPINNASLYISFLGILIGAAYFVVGGMTYGVPKYYFPLTALISLIVAQRLYSYMIDMRRINFFLLVSLCAIFGAGYAYVGDPLYLINHELKVHALANMPFKPVLIKLFFIFVIYTLPLLAAIWFGLLGKKSISALILLLGMGSQMFGLNLRQVHAPYQIVYGYGYEGLDRVYAQLPIGSSILLPEAVLVPPIGIISGHNYLPFSIVSEIPTLREWESYIESKKPDVLIYGIALNTVVQMKKLYENQEFREFMLWNYNFHIEGDYCIYLRK